MDTHPNTHPTLNRPARPACSRLFLLAGAGLVAGLLPRLFALASALIARGLSARAPALLPPYLLPPGLPF